MNNCYFIGKLTDDPVLEKVDDVDAVFFTLAIEDFRKNKSGQKVKRVDILNFEAWHTAAITICNNSKKGDLLAIECSARNSEYVETDTIFRINNFKIFDKTKYSLTE
jgi:single-stranded DNA-binding protein